MTVTSLNQNKTFVLTLTPRELSILISSVDCTMTQVEASGVIPEDLVPSSAKNQPDPSEDELMRSVADAKLMQSQLVAVLPNWREL